MTVETISPQMAQKCIEQGALLVDIRSFNEYTAEHIEQAVNMPLEQLGQNTLGNEIRDVIFYCRSGARTHSNAAQLKTYVNKGQVFILEGGLAAWKKAGLDTVKENKQPIEMSRQIQIVAGSLVVLGIILGTWVSPWFYLLPLFVGAGLVFAGVTGFCGMALVLMKMPWNQKK